MIVQKLGEGEYAMFCDAHETQPEGNGMGKARAKAVVLDAGALIAFERGDPRMRALCRESLRTGAKFLIPAGDLGQVWLTRQLL